MKIKKSKTLRTQPSSTNSRRTTGVLLMSSVGVAVAAVSCMSPGESDRTDQAAVAVLTVDEAIPGEIGQAAENFGEGNSSVFRPARVSTDTDAIAWAREVRSRASEGAGTLPAPQQSSTDSLRALAASTSSPEVMTFHVTLDDPGFDFRSLNTRDSAQRQDRVAARIEQLRPSQDRAEAAIRALGGRVVGRYWLANQLAVEAPRAAVASILDLPEVTAGFEEPTIHSGVAYNGSEVRAGTLATVLHNAGFRGDARSRTGAAQRIRIAITEAGRLIPLMSAFRITVSAALAESRATRIAPARTPRAPAGLVSIRPPCLWRGMTTERW